jgi:putative ABC transport system permease protein
MFKLTLRNLGANKARLTLTGMAVVLGVGFVVASLITSDGLRDSFNSLSREITTGTDLTVRSVDRFGTEDDITDETLEIVSSTEGVDTAEGAMDGFVQPVAPDGTPLSATGAPLIGVNWLESVALNQSTLIDGVAPGDGQFVIDVDTAETHGFEIGQTYSMITERGVNDFELSGIHRFGEDNNLLGAVLTGFTADDLRTIIDVEPGHYDEIVVDVIDSADVSQVGQSIAAGLSTDLEVVNQQTVEQETAADFNNGISILQNIFLGFAGVSLFVAVFIVYNTFGVVLAQRVREIGLLRAVGATPRQIRGGIIGESLLVGLLASAMGVAVGMGLHLGLLAAFDALGFGLPDSDLILAPRTVVVGMVIGVVTTLVSALVPAARAGTVSPVVALTGTVAATGRPARRTTIAGIILLVSGVALGVVGFQGLGSTTLTISALAAAALLVFVAVTMLSPWATGPVVGVLTRPVSWIAGPSGNLAGKNAVRNPGRTATTAGSLMIGLALITTALIVGESFKSQVSTTLDTATSADYLISDDAFGRFPTDVVDRVEGMPEVGTVMAGADVRVRMTAESTTAPEPHTTVEQFSYGVADLDALATLFDLSVDQGTIADTDVANPIVLPREEADDYGVTVGDTLFIEFDGGEAAEFEIIATYTDQSIIDGGIIGLDATRRYVDIESFEFLAADVAEGSTAAEAEAAMSTLTADYPQLTVQSSADYRELIENDIDTMLNAISMMLALAILIALIGIGLTLALAIVERTREIGLLRAVGMTRRQTRKMIRWEAAAIAMFGAVLGIAIGLVFGWGSVAAIPDGYLGVVSVPTVRLVAMVLAAAMAGLFAALLPARRAGRLDVLDAIAME